MKKLVRESLFEKFTEKGDPIKDMRIGAKYVINEKIKKFLQDNHRLGGEWPDEEVNVLKLKDSHIFNSDLTLLKGIDDSLDKLIAKYEKLYNEEVLPARKISNDAWEKIEFMRKLIDKYMFSGLKVPKDAPSVYAGKHMGSNQDLLDAEKLSKIASDNLSKVADPVMEIAQQIADKLNYMTKRTKIIY